MKLMLTAGAMLALATAGQAHATALTLDLTPATIYQQTQNSPCVIGDPSCHNPAGFGSTTLAANQGTYTNVGSPTYTVGQIRGLVGDTFSVGIDVNTTTHPAATEVLDSFSLAINGTTQFLYTGPTQLLNNHNGNGYSDAQINGFDLSNFAANLSARFFVTYHNATDGREEFFLIGPQSPGTAVFEPATATTLALGLAGLAAGRRRKQH